MGPGRRSKNAVHGGGSTSIQLQLPFILFVLIGIVTLLVYLVVVPDAGGQGPGKLGDLNGNTAGIVNNGGHAHIYREKLHSVEVGLRSTAQRKRDQFAKALDSLSTSSNSLQGRLKILRDKNEIVGERLIEIKKGKETVQEILHAAGTGQKAMKNMISDQPPMTLDEVISYLDEWIRGLHKILWQVRKGTYPVIWQAYHDYAVKTLYVWDREYLTRMPPRRDDGSIFLSIATYRDAECVNTIKWAYEKAKNPDKLFVGLVQQNCHENCVSGVLDGGVVESVGPDVDCYKSFCEGEGMEFCDNGQVRVLNIEESESLGPYAARFFASKLWFGEQWYMQIDAHMTFAQHWDAISVNMLQRAPSKKPIITHYPPPHKESLDNTSHEPAPRICGPVFASDDLEAQVIRLEDSGVYDKEHNEIPRFAPFVAAGYFVAHSEFLREVPFDPFLPWIFMGEEIIMSTRLWTSGYDIFSPSQSVIGHMYVRRHQPKFWETVGRDFTPGVHNPLMGMILDRVKYQLGYPEAAKDMIASKNILTAVEQYSMGSERPLSDYMKMVGLDMTTKELSVVHWCKDGMPPPGSEQFNHLYE